MDMPPPTYCRKDASDEGTDGSHDERPQCGRITHRVEIFTKSTKWTDHS